MSLAPQRRQQREIVLGYVDRWMKSPARSRLRYQVMMAEAGHPLAIREREDVVVAFSDKVPWTVRWVRSLADLERMRSSVLRQEKVTT